MNNVHIIITNKKNINIFPTITQNNLSKKHTTIYSQCLLSPIQFFLISKKKLYNINIILSKKYYEICKTKQKKRIWNLMVRRYFIRFYHLKKTNQKRLLSCCKNYKTNKKINDGLLQIYLFMYHICPTKEKKTDY